MRHGNSFSQRNDNVHSRVPGGSSSDGSSSPLSNSSGSAATLGDYAPPPGGYKLPDRDRDRILGSPTPPSGSNHHDVRQSAPSPGPDLGMRRVMTSLDGEEVKEVGNEYYRKGRFVEALQLYERAILLAPNKAPFRANRAAALGALERIDEAIKECEEAVALDVSYIRAHQRLALLHLRLGRFVDAKTQIRKAPEGLREEAIQIDRAEEHWEKAKDLYAGGDLKGAFRECGEASSLGVDLLPPVSDAHGQWDESVTYSFFTRASYLTCSLCRFRGCPARQSEGGGTPV